MVTGPRSGPSPQRTALLVASGAGGCPRPPLAALPSESASAVCGGVLGLTEPTHRFFLVKLRQPLGSKTWFHLSKQDILSPETFGGTAEKTWQLENTRPPHR